MLNLVLISIVCVGFSVDAFNTLVTDKPTWPAGCEVTSHPDRTISAAFQQREEGLASEDECKRSCEADPTCGSYQWFKQTPGGPCDKFQLNDKMMEAAGLDLDELVEEVEYSNIGMKTCDADLPDDACSNAYYYVNSGFPNEYPASKYRITGLWFDLPSRIANQDCLDLCDQLAGCRTVVWKDRTVGDTGDVGSSCELYTTSEDEMMEKCGDDDDTGNGETHSTTLNCRIFTKYCY